MDSLKILYNVATLPLSFSIITMSYVALFIKLTLSIVSVSSPSITSVDNTVTSYTILSISTVAFVGY